MNTDPDANPLWDKDGNDFTDELIAFWGKQVVGQVQKTGNMKIAGNEAKAFHARLKEALKSGNTYLGYDTSKKSWRDSVHFYRDQQEARQWIRFREVQFGIETKTLPLLVIEQRLTRELELQQLANPKQKIPNDIELDVAFIAKQEIARQQIFTDELQKKLLQEGFDSSIKQALKAEILKDLPQFEINGIRTVNGKEAWYTVKVEQNQDRAFQISAIVPELEARMEKMAWKHAYYDPLEQNVEVESLADRVLLRQIWKVVDDIQDLAQSGPDGLKRAMALEHKYWKDTPMEGTLLTLIDNNLKEKVMSEQVNDKNFEYLSKQLKHTGFGEGLQPALKEAMQRGDKEFTLGHIPEFAKDTAAATLHFKRSDTSELYFFNKFNVVVKNEQFPDAAKQSFEIYNNSQQDNVTLKQAYNLLEGRAIHRNLATKEGEPYAAWQQLNFNKTTPNGNFEVKQYHQNYGFDLEKTLAKYPIQELQTEKYKESLIKSLERGNLQSVTLLRDGKEEKVFITPNLAFKTLAFHDAEGKRLSQQVLFPKAEDGAYLNQDNALKKGQKEGLNGNSQTAAENGQSVKDKNQGQAVEVAQNGKSETTAQAKEMGSNSSQRKGLKEALGVKQSVGEQKKRTRKQG